MLRRRVSVGLVVAVAVSGASSSAALGAAKPRVARLVPFESCPTLLNYAARYAGRPAVPVQAAGGPIDALAPRPSRTPQPAPTEPAGSAGSAEGGPVAASAPTALPAASQDASSEAFSVTNNQEAAVDEADLAKSDGRRLFVLTGRTLRVYDIRGAAPALTGTLSLDADGEELLLSGDRLLVISSVNSPIAVTAQVSGPVAPAPPPSTTGVPAPTSSETRLIEVDVHDPAAPKVARTMTIPGTYVSARLTAGTARVVVSSTPRTFAPTLRRLLPTTVLKSGITRRTYRRQLVRCESVAHPAAFSGMSLLTVLSFDLSRGMYNIDRDAVLAGAQVVYGSDRSLYVASLKATGTINEPSDVPPGTVTEIHRFDASKPGETTYASSGTVPGFVLNQYALSEDKGVLRVASTEDPLWLEGAQQQDSASTVTVLREQGGKLAQIGRLGGLGRGERIYAARFIGDAGYLVTFRQTDPLFTLDLSDPTAPKLVGELQLLGYSAYLHPIGDDLLLGIGQEATGEGWRIGAQVSLFDVRDPAHPTRLGQLPLGAGSSGAEFDPRAFLWWAPTQSAVVPLRSWGATPFGGAVVIHAGRDGVRELGRVSHGRPTDVAEVRRSFVVGDRLLTITDLGLAAHRLGTLQPLGETPFLSAE